MDRLVTYWTKQVDELRMQSRLYHKRCYAYPVHSLRTYFVLCTSTRLRQVHTILSW